VWLFRAPTAPDRSSKTMAPLDLEDSMAERV